MTVVCNGAAVGGGLAMESLAPPAGILNVCGNILSGIGQTGLVPFGYDRVVGGNGEDAPLMSYGRSIYIVPVLLISMGFFFRSSKGKRLRRDGHFANVRRSSRVA